MWRPKVAKKDCFGRIMQFTFYVKIKMHHLRYTILYWR